MPRKIDYEGKAKANEVRRQLYRQSAIINALKDKNVHKAELLSGKYLAPTVSPVQEVLKEEEVARAAKPVIDAIKNIPRMDYEEMEQSFSSALENFTEDGVVQRAVQSGEVNIDEKLNEALITSSGLLLPSDILKGDYDLKFMQDSLAEAKAQRNNVSRRIGGMKRSSEYKEATQETQKRMLKTLEDNRKDFQAYMSRVRGIIDNKEVFGKGILTSLEDVLERFKVLIGEIQAGNTNKKLRNEASEIAHYLYSKGHFPKKLYANLMSNI